MGVRKRGFAFLFFVGVAFALIGLSSAGDPVDCFKYSSDKGGNQSICEAVNNGSSCIWTTPSTDPWCDLSGGCCINIDCKLMDGTNKTYCETGNPYLQPPYNLSCLWDPNGKAFLPNGSVGAVGVCVFNCTGPNCGNFGGSKEGCWQNDADKASCIANKCNWVENDQNQEPKCPIKSLSDAKAKNPNATSDDIGCCEQPGCWQYSDNQTECSNAFGGLCSFDSKINSCNPKWCSEITDETSCNKMKTLLMMPCNWTGTACEDIGSNFYKGDPTSCFASGGWLDSSGNCQMPNDTNVFLFAGEANCFFADNRPTVCGNITGCVYCDDNATELSNASSACYQVKSGMCQGHQPPFTNWNGTSNVQVLDISFDPLSCSNISIKSACLFGPLPFCVWKNSSVNFGPYCSKSLSKIKKPEPPVSYCEDPKSKNNYTLCMSLINDYLMPCQWDNSSSPPKNCTFNKYAVFGKKGKGDFEEINNELACIAAGGTWNSEYYVDGGLLKQDSWCDVSGSIDLLSGKGLGGKANCDETCWACEFQPNGSAWPDLSSAKNACESSSLGYCEFREDDKAFNGFGWCDYPQGEKKGEGIDCNKDCGDCNFMKDPYNSCLKSFANDGKGCQWVNDTSSNQSGAGFCVEKGKKTCENDCFSCFSENSCLKSKVECDWDENLELCKPSGFKGEICFDGLDNDGDRMIDCKDPDCAFDNFCGGNLIGGDCFSKKNETSCNSTIAFNGLHCIWLNDTWNPNGWCDMPGANCKKFNDDLVACGAEPGCTNSSGLKGGFCDLNETAIGMADCLAYDVNESYCNSAPGNCKWVNDSWCNSHPTDQWCITKGGFCDFAPIATCKSYSNSSACLADSNCIWNTDPSGGEGGFCDIACFNASLSDDPVGCSNVGGGGLCEWTNLSLSCQPEFFVKGGGGGGSDCFKYDGNQTACNDKNITCVYEVDSTANNNVSVNEPSGWCMDISEYNQFGKEEGDVIDLGFDSDNINGGPPGAESGVDELVDLIGLGMRVTDEGFQFGGEVWNISGSLMCNGYKNIPVNSHSSNEDGSGNRTTKFYVYLDTDGNKTNGCKAYGQSKNDTGYDFMIKYVSKNSSSGPVETKQMLRCSNSKWIKTNVLITTTKKLSCRDIGGFMVSVEKEGLKAFDEFNETAVMRIFFSSANSNHSRKNPSDSVGPLYYSPGSINFDIVDCSDPDTKDSKCKSIQKYGFNVFEECMNGIDDNEDGLADCSDPLCTFTPQCAGSKAFDFSNYQNDYRAPTVTFTEVKETGDGAFIRLDTDEPSNLSVLFYGTDSGCDNLNSTINDEGSEAFQKNANYKPFHSVDLMVYTLGFSLTNGTDYYYKTKVCDPANNCGISKCLNFTTKESSEVKEFIFRIKLPEGYTADIPAFGKFGYNFTENFGGKEYKVGIKTNTSVTKQMNFTINCDSGLSIGFYGVNLLEPTKIDLSNAFICDKSNKLIGLNSSLKAWHKLIEDLKLGGATDYLVITFPVAYSSSNVIKWTDDSGSNGQTVNDYVSCSGNSSITSCKVPVSMGFSAYTVSSSTQNNGGSPSGGGGSSSGGGGGGGGGTDSSPPVANNSKKSNQSENVPAPSDSGNAPGEGKEPSREGNEGLKSKGRNIWAYVVVIVVILLVVGFLIKKIPAFSKKEAKTQLSK